MRLHRQATLAGSGLFDECKRGQLILRTKPTAAMVQGVILEHGGLNLDPVTLGNSLILLSEIKWDLSCEPAILLLDI